MYKIVRLTDNIKDYFEKTYDGFTETILDLTNELKTYPDILATATVDNILSFSIIFKLNKLSIFSYKKMDFVKLEDMKKIFNNSDKNIIIELT